MFELTAVVVLVKAVVLALGGVITHLAYRAYRRTGSPPLRGLALGIGVVTVGAFLGGGLDQLVGVDLEWGVLVHSVSTAAGFAVVLRSLYQVDG